MRLPAFTLFLSTLAILLLSPLPVPAIHPNILARREHHHNSPALSHAILHRQHQPRALLDICVSIDADLLANTANLLGLGPLNVGADLTLCLCLKDLDIFLNTNAEIQGLVSILGKSAVSLLLKAIINTSPDARKCSLPPHAHRTCNNHDPCHYDCDEHYVRNGNNCVCAPPYSMCNGVCGSFPHGCGSSVPRAMLVHAKVIVSLAQAKAVCKPHERVCGIAGRENTLDFECIDVASKADSCGGCISPHPFPEPSPILHQSGQDCSHIPNAKSVKCAASQCVIDRCKAGWHLNSEKNECLVDRSRQLKLRRIKKRSVQLAVDVASTVTVDSELLSKVGALVGMVLDLNSHCPTHSIPLPDGSHAGIPDVSESISRLVTDITAATANLLTSTSGILFLSTITTLYDSASFLASVIRGCGCIDKLDLHSLEADLNNVIIAILDLKDWYHRHPPASFLPRASITGCSHATDANVSDGIHTSPVGLSDLGIKGGQSGVVVDGFDDGVGDAIDSLLDELTLGPSNYKSDFIISESLPASLNSSAIPIVAKLDRRLNAVGVELMKSSATVPDSAVHLGSSTEELLNGLKERRFTMTDANATLDSDLLVQLNGLLNLVLNLYGDSTSLPHSSPGPSLDSDIAVSGLVTAIVNATVDLVSSPTVSTLVASIDNLFNISSIAQGTLKNCDCADTLGWLLDDLRLITEAALVLRDWCHSHPVVPVTNPTPSTTTHPSVQSPPHQTLSIPASPVSSDISASMVIGLTKLLSGLGLSGIKTVATVSGLGSGLSDYANGLLNTLGIGPNGIRRRVVVGRNMNSETHANVTAAATISSDLLAKLEALVDIMLALQGSSHMLPPPLTSPAPVPPGVPVSVDSGLVASVVRATVNLLISTSTLTLITNVDDLVDITLLVESALDGCSCVGSLGLGRFVQEFLRFSEAALDLQSYCHHHPIVIIPPNIASPSHSSHGSPPDDIPIMIGLKHLLVDDGVGGVKAAIAIGGFGSGLNRTVNGLLDTFGIGPEGVRRRSTIAGANVTTNVNSNLLAMLEALTELVLDLDCPSDPPLQPPHGTITPHPHPGPVAGDTGLVSAIVNATVAILTSHTTSDLVAGIDNLVNITALAQVSLNSSEHLTSLDLGTLVKNLALITKVALNLQDWCHSHPIVTNPPSAPSHPYPTATPPDKDDIPITLNLDHLLQGLELGGLDGVVTVGGVGSELTSAINGLLGDLGIGPGVETTPIVDANVLAKVDALVDLVLDIAGLSGALPPALPGITPSHPIDGTQIIPGRVDTGLVAAIVNATTSLLSVRTTSALVVGLDQLINIGSLVQSSLHGCRCVDSLGLGQLVRYLDLLSKSALDLQSWCHSHPTAIPVSSGPEGHYGSMTDAPFASSGLPLTISLSKLLSGLGSGLVNSTLIVDRLGNKVNDAGNSLLDDLGVGPDGVRKREDPVEDR